MKDQLIKYANYNYWANELLLSIIEKEVSDEMLDKEIISSFPSLRKTVYHIWDAENIWLKRLNGESFAGTLSKDFKGTFYEAKQKMLANDELFTGYIKSLSEEKLHSAFEYKNLEGKTFSNAVWESIHHCMNHSTYHRGQIVTILRQLGITNIKSTDFIGYCRM